MKFTDVVLMSSMSKSYIYLLSQNSAFPNLVKIGRLSFWV
ncbi:MAG: AlpA family phage regulatory protein [Thiomicrospira sp.]